MLFHDSHYGTGTITVEFPMDQDEIQKQRARGSFLSTFGTVVSVPRGHIREVVFLPENWAT